MTATETTWEPGDPLYARGPYRDHVFNFRDEDEPSEDCNCGDAARWPNPITGRGLPDRDELEEFIIRWRAAQEVAE